MISHDRLSAGEPGLFVGFDLGHGESCLVRVQAEGDDRPVPLKIDGSGRYSFPTALAKAKKDDAVSSENPGEEDITWLIGQAAVSSENPDEFEIGFKSMPTQSPSWPEDRPRLVKFARQCHAAAKKFLPSDESTQRFIIGCPTGWSNKDIEIYTEALVEAGLPNPQVERESRAALIQARDSKLIPREKLNGSIVVIDLGSSTTDVTHVSGLEVKKVFDVKDGHRLGASLIDQFLFDEIMRDPSKSDWNDYFRDNRADRNVALFNCRLLKEKYFSSTLDRRAKGVAEILPFAKGDLILKVTQPLMDRALNTPLEALGNLSWIAA